MQRYLVRLDLVDTFDDIFAVVSMLSLTGDGIARIITDFSISRPIGSKCPECWPCSANTTWHVVEIKDDQASLVSILAGNTNARSTVWS